MAIIQRISDAIFGGNSRTFLTDGTDDVLFDTTFEISKDSSATVTRHAIEKGSDVTDHIVQEPKSYSLSVIISDADLSLLDPFSFFNKSVTERLTILNRWKVSGEVLKFASYNEDIESLVIENLSETYSSDTGEAIGLSIGLKKINIVSSQTSTLTLKQGVTSKGPVAAATKSVPVNPAAVTSSILSKVIPKP